jgi:3-oxoacyl-[acyl-carrier protein] reductase
MNKGKLVLVTGGSRGIGKAICLELASIGCTVLFTYISNDAAAEETQGELRSVNNAPHKAYKCNMSDAATVGLLFKEIHKEYGKVEVLINNAGITGDAKLFIMTKDQDWWQIFDNNMQSVLNTVRYVLPGMISRKNGIIINIGSLSAKEGTPGSSAYSASKAAIIAFTKCLFKEYAMQGIQTYSVSPGFVSTDMIKDVPEVYMRYRMVKSPLRRPGKPEEIASLVAYLADSPPALLGGQDISIDGLQ